MSQQFPSVVDGRPICASCGKPYGERHKEWPRVAQKPLPWNGKSWRAQYNPFCTLRCALVYARHMFGVTCIKATERPGTDEGV